MSLITLAELKTYLGIVSSSDDTILQNCINASKAIIENYTSRYFESRTETRYFAWERGDEILLDQDLLQLNSLVLDSVTIPPADIVLLPKNSEAKTKIKLKNFYYPSDLDAAFWEVSGSWGFSAQVPADIKMACTRLAAFLYRQKDSQVFDVTAMPEVGQIVIPQGIPKDVMIQIKPYRRYLV